MTPTTAAHQLTIALTKRVLDGTVSPTVPTFPHGTRRLITAHLAGVPVDDREQVAREALAAFTDALAVAVDQLTGEGVQE